MGSNPAQNCRRYQEVAGDAFLARGARIESMPALLARFAGFVPLFI
jgi:hypothetical protein